MEYSLAEERTRIREIAEPVLERFRKMRGTDQEPNVVAQSISVQGADATYQNAKLSREIAEIAVKEYEQGIYLQNVATAEGEMRLAESDAKRGTDQIKHSSEILERVKKAASGSVFDTMSVVQVEAMVKVAELSKRKAEFEVEQAKSKLKLLQEYEKPKRLKELRSEVEKARSDELAKEQTLELEKTKLAMMKKQAEGFRTASEVPAHPLASGRCGPARRRDPREAREARRRRTKLRKPALARRSRSLPGRLTRRSAKRDDCSRI